MKPDTTSVIAPVANAERGEVLVVVAGQSHIVRFSLRFLKALSDQGGESGPADVLARMQTAPISALIDMAAMGIQMSVPGLSLDDAVLAAEDLPPVEQEALFAAALHSVTKSPLLAALNRGQAA